MDDPWRAFFALLPAGTGFGRVQESTSICKKPRMLELYAGTEAKTAERQSGCRLLGLKPVELGARMRLQIGFTLATVFLALFTAALWKERSRKEGRR